MYRTKQLLGEMYVFAKKITVIGYENFVEDAKKFSKIRRKIYFKKSSLT
jgi:hypothetical protein